MNTNTERLMIGFMFLSGILVNTFLLAEHVLPAILTLLFYGVAWSVWCAQSED